MAPLMDWLLGIVYKYIEHFIEPIQGSQVDLSYLLTGKIVLTDIQIKQAVLNFSPLPLNLQFNYIGRISIILPIWSFFTNSVKVEIEDIVLVVSTKGHKDWDRDAFAKTYIENKKKALQAQESGYFLNSLEDGILWRVAMKIGGNVKATVKNVHIRFEDWYSAPHAAFALGASVGSVTVGNVNTEEEDAKVAELYQRVSNTAYSDTNLIRKKIAITELAIYCDSLLFPDVDGAPPSGNATSTFANARNRLVVYDPSHRRRGLCLAANEETLKQAPEANGVTPMANATQSGTTEEKTDRVGLIQSVLGWIGFGKTTETTTEEDNKDGQGQPHRKGPPDPRRAKFTSNKTFPIPQHYAMDGRWAYRDIFAEYCSVRIYDPRDGGHWRDAAELMKIVEVHTKSMGTQLRNVQIDPSTEEALREAEKVDRLLAYQQELLKRHHEESRLPKSSMPPGVVKPIRSSEKEPQPSSPFAKKDFAKELMLPALKVKPECLPQIRELMSDLAKAYHQFILPPKDLSMILSLTLLPVALSEPSTSSAAKLTQRTKDFVRYQVSRVVGHRQTASESSSQSDAERDESTAYRPSNGFFPNFWSRRKPPPAAKDPDPPSPQALTLQTTPPPKDKALNILPMARLDLDLSEVRISIRPNQIAHLLAWAELYANLYPAWATAIKASLESPRPPFDAARVYLDAWIVKMACLQGSAVPDDYAAGPWPNDLTEMEKNIAIWCHEFEMRYASSAVTVLRREAMDRWIKNSTDKQLGSDALALARGAARFFTCRKSDASLSAPSADRKQMVRREPPKSGVGDRTQIYEPGTIDMSLDRLYTELLSEFDKDRMGNTKKALKKFHFTTDVCVNLLLSDVQLFICLGDDHEDDSVRSPIEVEGGGNGEAVSAGHDLSIMVEGVSVEVLIKSDLPSGLMNIDLNLYTVSVWNLSGFPGSTSPLALINLDKDEMIIKRKDIFEENRRRVLRTLAAARMLPEEETRRFGEFGKRRGPHFGSRRHRQPQQSTAIFLCEPLLLIARQKPAVFSHSPRRRRHGTLDLDQATPTATDQPSKSHAPVGTRHIFEFFTKGEQPGQSPLTRLLQSGTLSPSLKAGVKMWPYRLPDIPDMEIDAKILGEITVIAVVPALMSILGGMVPVIGALGFKDLFTLKDICSQVDVAAGRAFQTASSVGDLPHGSMSISLVSHADILVVVPAVAPEGCPQHPVVEGLVARVSGVEYSTKHLAPRKCIEEALKLPASDQTDVFEIKIGSLSVTREYNCFSEMVRHDPMFFMGKAAAVPWSSLSSHYGWILRHFMDWNHVRHEVLKSRGAVGTMKTAKIEADLSASLAALSHTPDYSSQERSYLLYPATIAPIIMAVTHLPVRYGLPTLHIDLDIERLPLEVNTCDIVLLATLAQCAATLMSPFNGALTAATQRMTNAATQAEYIIMSVKPIVEEGSEGPIPIRISVEGPTGGESVEGQSSTKNITRSVDVESEGSTFGGDSIERDLSLILEGSILDRFSGSWLKVEHELSESSAEAYTPVKADLACQTEGEAQEEVALERWSRLSRHVDFGGDDTSWQRHSSFVPSSEGRWGVSDHGFMVFHVRMGILSVMVCGLDVTQANDSFLASKRLVNWDSKISYPPKHIGYNQNQVAVPLMSVHLARLTTLVSMGSSGCLDAKVGLGDLRINEELGMANLGMSRIYSTSEHLQPVYPMDDLTTLVSRRFASATSIAALLPTDDSAKTIGVQEVVPDESLFDTQDHLAYCIKSGKVIHECCHLGAVILQTHNENFHHIRASVEGDLSTMTNVKVTCDISPLRLTLPLEFVDELLRFVSEMTIMMPIAAPLKTVEPVYVPQAFQPELFRHLDDPPVPQLDLLPPSPLEPMQRRLTERASVKLTVGAMEIIIPIEPIRMPTKGQAKKTTFDTAPSPEQPVIRLLREANSTTGDDDDNRITTPTFSHHPSYLSVNRQNTKTTSSISMPDSGFSGGQRKLSDFKLFETTEDALKRKVCRKWQETVKAHMQRTKLGHRLMKKTQFRLPMCFALRLAINVEIVLHSYANIRPMPLVLRQLHARSESGSRGMTSASVFLGSIESEDSAKIASQVVSSEVVTSPSWTERSSSSPSRRLFRFRRTLDQYRWVERCVRAPVAPNPTIRLFCPGQLDITMAVTSITADFVRPYCQTPLRYPRVSWVTGSKAANEFPWECTGETESRSIAPMIEPLDLTLGLEISLPSERTMWERYYGFSKAEAAEARKLFGITDPLENEAAICNIWLSGLVMSLTPSKITELLKLKTVAGDFAAHNAERDARVALFTQVLIRNAKGLRKLEDEDEIEEEDVVAVEKAQELTSESEVSAEEEPVEEQEAKPTGEAAELNFVEWLLDKGVAPTLSQELFAFNIATSWDLTELHVQAGIVTITISHQQDVFELAAAAEGRSRPQPPHNILQISITDLSFNLKAVAVSCLTSPPAWWLDLNPMEDVLAGTDVIALSFVSYDFEPLRKNPYRMRPQERKGLYYKTKAAILSFIETYKSNKLANAIRPEAPLDAVFRGRITQVHRQIAAAMPWVHFNGEMLLAIAQQAYVPNNNILGTNSETLLLEPCSVQFIGGKRSPESQMHVTTEVSWVNLNVSLYLLEVLLSLASEIISVQIPKTIRELYLTAFTRHRRTRGRMAKPNTLRSTTTIVGSLGSTQGRELHLTVVPSFARMAPSLMKTKVWMCGKVYPITPAMSESNLGAKLWLRPPGAWDAHQALEKGLNEFTQMLGSAFFNAGRRVRTATDVPSAFPSLPSKSSADEASQAVLEMLTGAAPSSGVHRTKVILSVVNLLGQPMAVWRRGEARSGEWQFVSSEESIEIEVVLDGGRRIIVEEFAVRLRLLNDVFDLRSAFELANFVETVQSAIAAELVALRSGKVEVLPPRSSTRFYRLNVSGFGGHKREKPPQNGTNGRVKARASQVAVHSPTVTGTLRTYFASIETRSQIPLLARLHAKSEPCLLKGGVPVESTYRLVLSSPFTLSNLSRDEILVVPQRPLTIRDAKSMPKTQQDIAGLARGQAAFASVLVTDTPTSLEHWLSSREAATFLYTLPPPPPPVSTAPSIAALPTSLEPDLLLDNDARKKVTSGVRRAISTREMAMPSSGVVSRCMSLSGVSAISGYLAAGGVRETPPSSETSIRENSVESISDTEASAPVLIGRLRSLFAEYSSQDGYSCLILPPNVVVEEATLEPSNKDDFAWPALWPRPMPLHWLLSARMAVHVADAKTVRHMFKLSTDVQISTADDLNLLQISPLNIHTPDTHLNERETNSTTEFLKQTRVAELGLLGSKPNVLNALLSATDLNRCIQAFPELAEKADQTSALRQAVARLDPKPRILTVVGPPRDDAHPSDNPSPMSGAALGDAPIDFGPPKTYAVSSAVVAPDPARNGGTGIIFETTISPLLEISNRLPRSIGVCNVRLQRRAPRPRPTAEESAERLPGSSPKVPDGDGPFSLTTESKLDISGRHPSPIDASQGKAQILAGESALLPLSGNGLQFSFGRALTLGLINVDVRALEAETLEVLFQKKKSAKSQGHKRSASKLGLSDFSHSLARDATASGASQSDFGDGQSSADDEEANKSKLPERYLVFLEINPGNLILSQANAPKNNSDKGRFSQQDSIKIPGRTFMKTLTLYTDGWVVNRLNYPLTLKARTPIKLEPHRRTVVSIEVARQKNLKLAMAKSSVNLVPGSRFFVGSSGNTQWKKLAPGSTMNISSPFTFSTAFSVATPIEFPGYENNNALSLVAWMTRAPSPFLRTSTLELLPAYVIANDRDVSMYVRETPTVKRFTGDTKLVHGAFVAVPPGARIEFHPQKKRKNGAISIQISALPEVERFHQVIVQASEKRKQTPTDEELAQDAPLWSVSVAVNTAQLVQVRHPCEESPSMAVGAFDLTDVSVTVKNGVRLISLITNQVPSYRLVNLSSIPLAIAQHKLDGPFEVLKPGNTNAKFALKSDNDAATSMETQKLLSRSLAFNFYEPEGLAKMDIWVVGSSKEKVRNSLDETENGAPVKTKGRRRSGAPEIVMSHRRQQAVQGEVADEAQPTEMVAATVMTLIRTDRPRKETKEVDAAFRMQMLDVSDNLLKVWSNQKRRNARLMDVAAHFDVDRRRKLQGREPVDRLLLLPMPNSPERHVGVRVKLRFVSGVKWLVFDDFKGQLPRVTKTVEDQVTNMKDAPPPLTAAQIISAQTKRRKVNELYLKAQEDIKFVNPLVSLVSVDDDALNELCRIYPFGNHASKKAVAAAYKEVTGGTLKTVLKNVQQEIKLAEEEAPAEDLQESSDAAAAGPGQLLIDDAFEVEPERVAETQMRKSDAQTEEFILDPHDAEIPEVNMTLSLDIRIMGLGLDLVDSRRCRDVIYLSVAKIAVTAEMFSEEMKLFVSLGWLQIDNQLKSAYYPTVVRPIVDLHRTTSRKMPIIEAQKDQRSIVLPGEDSHRDFAFADPSLFERDLLDRFNAPATFEFLQLVVAIRLASSADASQHSEDSLMRFITFQQKQADGRETQPAIPSSNSNFVQQLNACELPETESLNAGGLLDIPLCGVELSPVAVNVDLPLITACMMLLDKAIICLEGYSLDLLTGDATEIHRSEQEILSEPWRQYLGGAEALFSSKATLFKISISALDVGEIGLVLNVNIGGSAGGSKKKTASNRRQEERDFLAWLKRNETSVEDSPPSVQSASEAEAPLVRQNSANIVKTFVKENEDAAIFETDADVDEQPQSDVVRAVLSALKLHASMSDARISLPAVQHRDLAGPSDELALEIVSPYFATAAGQVAKVLGAIDLLGNPSLVFRHFLQGCNRAGSEFRIGCLGSKDRYQQLHPHVANRSRIFVQPCLTCFFGVKHVLVGSASAILECFSRCFGSWYNIMEQLARNGDHFSLFNNPVNALRRGDITEQPATVFEGVGTGFSGCLSLLAVSLVNSIAKPIRGCIFGCSASRSGGDEGYSLVRKETMDSDQEEEEVAEKSFLTSSKLCCKLFGTSLMSAVGSCVCGIPSALCLCGSMTSSGALHSIIKIPMLSSIRARRVFFRPAKDQSFQMLHQFSQPYAFWSTLSSSPARFARFLSIGRMNTGLQALSNTLFALPLACLDIASEQRVPAALLFGSQRMAFILKKGVKWSAPWRRVSTVDFVCVPGSTRRAEHTTGTSLSANGFFIRFVAKGVKSQSDADAHAFLIPCASLEIGWIQYTQILYVMSNALNLP